MLGEMLSFMRLCRAAAAVSPSLIIGAGMSMADYGRKGRIRVVPLELSRHRKWSQKFSFRPSNRILPRGCERAHVLGFVHKTIKPVEML
jgi:hypothetical protein